MTPAQQPKYYLITKDELDILAHEMAAYKVLTAKKAVLSRPYTQAPELTEHDMQYAYELGIWHGEMNKDEAAHAATLAENKRVLDAIMDCAETDGEWFRIDGTDTLYLNYSVLSKKVESLRQQAGAP